MSKSDGKISALGWFLIILCATLLVGGVYFLFRTIYAVGKDKAHPFEEFGETRIYHESMVLEENERKKEVGNFKV